MDQIEALKARIERSRELMQQHRQNAEAEYAIAGDYARSINMMSAELRRFELAQRRQK